MLREQKISRYGWKRDRLDKRDRYLTLTAKVSLPTQADLRTTNFAPAVYDQSNAGSCTANATAAAVDYARKKQGLDWLTPSRLFIYYNERAIEGTIDSDAGAEIRDGIKTLAGLGVCPEIMWPYDDQLASLIKKPTPECFVNAVTHKSLGYSRVTQQHYFIQHCLAILKSPVVFGFSVFDSFESDEVAKTGIVPMPGKDDQPIGGHAVVIVGYDAVKQVYIVRNSWGSDWGQAGYFTIPFAYVIDPDLADDFWTILLEQ